MKLFRIVYRPILITFWMISLCGISSSQTIYTKLSYRVADLKQLAKVVKSAATFPVYLPSLRSIPGRSTYLDIAEDNDYKYYVELENAPRCMGGALCSVGAIIGHKRMDPTVPILSGRRVTLADGTIGFWAEHQCAYVGCSYNGITFQRDGHYYEAALLDGSLNQTLALAKSMSQM